jgi:hypothetical protein
VAAPDAVAEAVAELVASVVAVAGPVALAALAGAADGRVHAKARDAVAVRSLALGSDTWLTVTVRLTSLRSPTAVARNEVTFAEVAPSNRTWFKVAAGQPGR